MFRIEQLNNSDTKLPHIINIKKKKFLYKYLPYH